MFFGPFLLIYGFLFFLLLAFWFVLVEIHVIAYAFTRAGLPPELAFVALLASLLGSWINIPIARLHASHRHPPQVVHYFGVRYQVPAREDAATVLAVNLGGAVVPLLVAIYLLSHQIGLLQPAVVATAIVALVVNWFARPIAGVGIATPMFIPPIVAALAAYLLVGSPHAGTVAFISGVLGTLIGADLANLGKLSDLGAPVASIGGAGTFDGIFLTGIVAVLLA